MSGDLLLELGTEDLPARYLAPLAQALEQGLAGGLGKRGVAIGPAHQYSTPRRIAVRIESVAAEQPQQHLERKGPQLSAAFKNGQPSPAALGFAKSCGVALEQLAQENGQLVFRKTVPGKATRELLPEIFEETLKQMDELVPKRMRWGSGEETFVRPVQWIVCLLGAEVVPLQRFGLVANRVTYGHRFHAPAPIELAVPADYPAVLRQADVWADSDTRKAEIRRQVEAEAALLGGFARITEDLLSEVAALVEWPVAVAGRMEDRFMQLPPEVIVATVETNQRYFTLFADAACTRLLPHFITVANIKSRDVSQIVTGNERVVRPRLSDALFFWEQDRKKPLADYRAELDRVTFQKDLGSIGDKARRITALAARLAAALGADPAAATEAASLAKADLVTRMVYEFPELQGLMGGYYAAASGASGEVAGAIREHYLPTQQGTPIPSTLTGQCVALADKLDTLAGIFAVGQKPTASKDPFALRRAALGVLRICVEAPLDFDLKALLAEALQAQTAGKRDSAVLDELWDFIVERLRSYCLDRGASTESFDAVRATGAALRPVDFDRRLKALAGFLGSEAAQSLAAADKRARNILRQAAASDRGEVQPQLFDSEAEHSLLSELQKVELALAPLRAQRDYASMLQQLATLKGPVDSFFASVMVMADDPAVRANRLALMARLDALCREVADLSCLPG